MAAGSGSGSAKGGNMIDSLLPPRSTKTKQSGGVASPRSRGGSPRDRVGTTISTSAASVAISKLPLAAQTLQAEIVLEIYFVVGDFQL